MGGPRRKAYGLHCTRPREVGREDWASLFVNLPARWRLFVTPNPIFVALSWSFPDLQSDELAVIWVTFPAQISHPVNNCPFYSPSAARFFKFWSLMLVILLFKMAPQQSTKVLSCFLHTRRWWWAKWSVRWASFKHELQCRHHEFYAKYLSNKVYLDRKT